MKKNIYKKYKIKKQVFVVKFKVLKNYQILKMIINNKKVHNSKKMMILMMP